MFLRKSKQGGFVSAELGIGILVISLLTIMGFLAATDLDDEISRVPSGNPMTYLSTIFAHSISSTQTVVDAGKWSNLYDTYMGSNSRFPVRAIAEEIGFFSESGIFPIGVSHGSKDYGQALVDQNGENLVVISLWASSRTEPEVSIRFETSKACKENLPDLKQNFSTFFPKSVDCTASNINRIFFKKPVIKGVSLIGGDSSDSSLDGTWMGDL